jgi:hypothetical protein
MISFCTYKAQKAAVSKALEMGMAPPLNSCTLQVRTANPANFMPVSYELITHRRLRHRTEEKMLLDSQAGGQWWLFRAASVEP